MEKEQYEYMLKHELFHIRHRDLSMKYIGLLVMAVHWYNPLAYLLFHEISVISELYCDSAVISGKGEDGRRKYGELILTLAAKNPCVGKGKFFAGMADSRNKNVYKRRILEMKRNKKQKTAAAVMMTALICMAGGATAFAYHEPYIIEDLTGENAIGNETYFMPESEKEEPEKLLSDYFFMDNEGNVCDISGSDISVQRTCTHDFSIHGTFSEHEKDGKGGCTVKLYDAMQCSKCSKVKKGKLKNAITYQICPH